MAVGNGNDVYIGTRVIMNRLKVSLHGSGVCQVAFANDYVNAVRQRGIDLLKGRGVVRWKRAATLPNGAICVASIRFPTDLLRGELAEQRTTKPVFHFEVAPSGKAVEIGFVYSREPPEALEPRLAQVGLPMLHWAQPCGEFVSVVSRLITFDPTIPPKLRKISSRGLLRNDVLQRAGEEMGGLSMVLFNHPQNRQALIITEVNGITIRREAGVSQE